MLFNMNAQVTNTLSNTNTTNHRTAAESSITISGSYNTASGFQTLNHNTTGSQNTASGAYALHFNTEGNQNTASGFGALHRNTEGNQNTASGFNALYFNTEGNQNTATGAGALHKNIKGSYNTASGSGALANKIEGEYNTAVGFHALNTIEKGNKNTAVGAETTTLDENPTNQTVIGSHATGQADHSVTLGNANVTAVYMGEDSGATVYAAGLRTASNPVLTLSENDATFADDVTVNGEVTVASDARLKTNIVSLGATLAKLLLIDGKTYTLKKNGKQKIGLLAQDIQKVFPELVHKNDNEMLAVNYQGLVPVMINALKEQEDKMKKQEGKLKEQEDKLKKQEDKISRLERLVEKFMVGK